MVVLSLAHSSPYKLLIADCYHHESLTIGFGARFYIRSPVVGGYLF